MVFEDQKTRKHVLKVLIMTRKSWVKSDSLPVQVVRKYEKQMSRQLRLSGRRTDDRATDRFACLPDIFGLVTTTVFFTSNRNLSLDLPDIFGLVRMTVFFTRNTIWI